MPQSWDMGQIILLPLRRKIFSHRKKSNGFGRDRTRELGNQRPALLLLPVSQQDISLNVCHPRCGYIICNNKVTQLYTAVATAM
jgi:hypothetical protein